MTITEPTIETLDAMSPAQLDALDYGVVRMDLEGRITEYNKREQDISGLDRDAAVDRNLFVEVAPCTNNFMVSQRYNDTDDLDESIDYVFTLKMQPTPVKLRMMRSKAAGSQYLLVGNA